MTTGKCNAYALACDDHESDPTKERRMVFRRLECELQSRKQCNQSKIVGYCG